MNDFRIHPFSMDVTPPIGDIVCGGLQEVSVGVESRLELRGLVLSTGGSRYVLAAIDYCYMIGRSHERFVNALARAAGVPASQATIHSNHVHDAPLLHEECHALIREYDPRTTLHNEQYVADVMERAAAAVKVALDKGGVEVGSVGFASHAVHEFASTRRVLGPDGSCRIRWSVCADQDIRSAPEGTIDPMLDQITFHDRGGRPLVCLNFYASHPQVSNRRGFWSADTVGIARELFEETHPGVMCIYFDGCGGDIAAGKYTTANRPRNRLVFGVRLFDAMEEAFLKCRPEPVRSFEWKDDVINVPLAAVPRGMSEYESVMKDAQAHSRDKYLVGLKLLRLRGDIKRYPFRLTLLRLNDMGVLCLPAELCVEYQLHAKAFCSGRLAVSAYGDCFLNYVAYDKAFAEGGYEVKPEWTEVGPGIEPILKGGMERILGGTA